MGICWKRTFKIGPNQWKQRSQQVSVDFSCQISTSIDLSVSLKHLLKFKEKQRAFSPQHAAPLTGWISRAASLLSRWLFTSKHGRMNLHNTGVPSLQSEPCLNGKCAVCFESLHSLCVCCCRHRRRRRIVCYLAAGVSTLNRLRTLGVFTYRVSGWLRSDRAPG